MQYRHNIFFYYSMILSILKSRGKSSKYINIWKFLKIFNIPNRWLALCQ